jgi:two-component system sensor histidine kinase HydH
VQVENLLQSCWKASGEPGRREAPDDRLRGLLDSLLSWASADSGCVFAADAGSPVWRRICEKGSEHSVPGAMTAAALPSLHRWLEDRSWRPMWERHRPGALQSPRAPSSQTPSSEHDNARLFLPLDTREPSVFLLLFRGKGVAIGEQDELFLRTILRTAGMNWDLQRLAARLDESRQETERLRSENTRLERKVEQSLEEHFQGFRKVEQQIAKLERIRTFAALAGKLGHEMKNRLGVMSNSLYFIRRKLKTCEFPVEKHLSILERELTRGTRFLSSLLNFSRLCDARRVPCDLNEILRKSVSAVRLSDKIRVQLDLRDPLPGILGDEERLVQAFTHLILNAAEAMAGGGELSISSRSRRDHIEIDFLDTGTGIRKEELLRLQEPFYTTKGAELGLGLLFCQTILQFHGGSLTLESMPGKGTLCRVKIATGLHS